MEQSFTVTLAGKSVGKVVVNRQGLYYLFSCRCNLTGDIIYRLTVSCGTTKVSLGILVPNNGCFMLNTKLPIKKFEDCEMIFRLLPQEENHARVFVPIKPDEPFTYISQLKESFLTLQNSQPGIFVSKKQGN